MAEKTGVRKFDFLAVAAAIAAVCGIALVLVLLTS